MERNHPRPHRSRLAVGTEALPIPGTKRVERIEENMGGADITFSSEELDEIRKNLDRMKIKGERYPADQERLAGR